MSQFSDGSNGSWVTKYDSLSALESVFCQLTDVQAGWNGDGNKRCGDGWRWNGSSAAMDRDEEETGREGCDGNKIWSDVWCGMRVISVRVPVSSVNVCRVCRPLLFVGPTGTGKTVYVQQKLMSDLSKDVYVPMFISFSARTTANHTQVTHSLISTLLCVGLIFFHVPDCRKVARCSFAESLRPTVVFYTCHFITARSELRKVLFLASSVKSLVAIRIAVWIHGLFSGFVTNGRYGKWLLTDINLLLILIRQMTSLARRALAEVSLSQCF